MTTTWYQCNVCQILLQNVHQFVVHKFKHEGDPGEAHGNVCHQLFHTVSGWVTLEELPEPTSLDLFLPKIKLNPVEDSCAEFQMEIYSPLVLLQSFEIETKALRSSSPVDDKPPQLAVTTELNLKCQNIPQNAGIIAGNKQIVCKNGYKRAYTHCPRCGLFKRVDSLKVHFRSCRGVVTLWRCSSLSCKESFHNEAELQTHLRLTNHTATAVLNLATQCSDGAKLTPVATVASTSSFVSPVQSAPGHTSAFPNRRRRKYFRIRVRRHKECPSCGESVLESNLARHIRSCAQQKQATGGSSTLLKGTVTATPISIPTSVQLPLTNSECEGTVDLGKKTPSIDTVRTHRLRARALQQPPDIPIDQTINPKSNVIVGTTILKRKTFIRRGPNGRRYIMAHCENCRRVMRLDKLKSHKVICQSNQGVKQNEVELSTATSAESETQTAAVISERPTTSRQLGNGSAESTESEIKTSATASKPPFVKRSKFRRKKWGKTIRPQLQKCSVCGVYMLKSNVARHLKICLAKGRESLETKVVSSEAGSTTLHSDNTFERPRTRESLRTRNVTKEVKVPIPSPTPPIMPSQNVAAEAQELNTKFRQRSTCPVCGRVQLTAHMPKHLEICDGSVNFNMEIEEGDKRRLTLTRRTKGKWRKEKMMPCRSCGRVLGMGNMARHVKLCESSTSKRPWRCTYSGCSATFTNPTGLQVHTQIYHIGVRKHRCSRCKKPFATESSLQNHVRRCQPQGEKPKMAEVEPLEVIALAAKAHACPEEVEKGDAEVEDAAVPQSNTDKNHLQGSPSVRKRRNRNVRTQCGNCGRIQLLTNLKRHQKICESRKSKTPWTCTFFGCCISLRTFGALERHVKIYHTGSRPYKCEYCDKNFATSESIRVHLKVCRHKGQVETEENVAEETVTVPNSGHGFHVELFHKQDAKADPLEVSDNIRIKGNDGGIQSLSICETCGRTLLSKSMTQHAWNCRPDKEKRRCRCPHSQCSATFPSWAEVHIHRNTCHGGNTEYRCEKCGTRFSSNKGLRAHWRRFQGRTCQKLQTPRNESSQNVASASDTNTNVIQPPTILISIEAKNEAETMEFNQDQPEPVPALSQNNFECEGCGKRFGSRRRVRCHFRRYCKSRFDGGEVKFYECNRCHKNYPSSASLGDHLRRTCLPNRKPRPRRKARIQPRLVSAGSDDIECVLENGETLIMVGEGSQTRTPDELRIGANRKAGSYLNPLGMTTNSIDVANGGISEKKCPKCERFVNRKNSRHFRTCTGKTEGPPWRCTYLNCHSIFSHESSLSEHVLIYHHTKRKFNCDKCGRKYPTAQALKRHQSRVVRCRSGKTDATIDNHEPIAADPMRCGYCHQEFPNEASLILHFRTPCTATAKLLNTSTALPELHSISVEEANPGMPELESEISVRPATRVVVKVEEDLMVQENISSSHPHIGSSDASFPNHGNREGEVMGINLEEDLQVIIPDIVESDSDSDEYE